MPREGQREGSSIPPTRCKPACRTRRDDGTGPGRLFAPGFFPQLPDHPLHEAVYGSASRPNELAGWRCGKAIPDLLGTVVGSPGWGAVFGVRFEGGRVRRQYDLTAVFVDARTPSPASTSSGCHALWRESRSGQPCGNALPQEGGTRSFPTRSRTQTHSPPPPSCKCSRSAGWPRYPPPKQPISLPASVRRATYGPTLTDTKNGPGGIASGLHCGRYVMFMSCSKPGGKSPFTADWSSRPEGGVTSRTLRPARSRTLKRIGRRRR